MNAYQWNELYKFKRHILAIACGIFGGSLPNKYSNIHPIIIGSIIAGLCVKMIYGDYDEGYKWTIADFLFWIITLIEGALGAFFILQL